MTKFKMTTGFILGLLEGDGSLLISIRNKPTNANNYSIRLGFQLAQHIKDIIVLEHVLAFLGCKTNIQNANASYKAQYGTGQVKRILISDLVMLTKFFIPLLLGNPMILSKRYHDLALFLRAHSLLVAGLHLTPEGLAEIIQLASSLSGKMGKLEKLGLPSSPNKITPEWVQGFTQAEGSFGASVVATPTSALGWRVILFFEIGQEACELSTLYLIRDFFACGSVVKANTPYPAFRVQGRQDLISIIFPFFNLYPLLSSKADRLELLQEIVGVMDSNVPMTSDNLREIRVIISKMKYTTKPSE